MRWSTGEGETGLLNAHTPDKTWTDKDSERLAPREARPEGEGRPYSLLAIAAIYSRVENSNDCRSLSTRARKGPSS